jgi:phosphoribosylanthranilate isomerase
MFVKICANTNLDDARLAVELGADAVGFVFAESKRKVTAEQVAAIIPHLPEAVEKVGVFMVTDADEILSADECRQTYSGATA